MTGLGKFALSVQKVRAAIHNRRKSSAAKEQRGSSLKKEHAGLPPLPDSSPWDLPVEIQIRIFAYSGITDFHPLRLVCKAFYQLLTRNEHEIVRQYLRLRRHGTLPSPIDDDRIYTRNPGDDVVLLSDLFPPSKSARGGHLYTFKYLHGLRRRQMLSSRLCYYLADRILDRFVQTEPAVMRASFPAKRNERNALVKRGIASIWFHLAPLMYYTLYFLESYTSARREHTHTLVQKYETGQLPVPLPLEIRQRMYRELQTRILQSPPFTNTAALVATHHCMHLLVSYIRFAMSPDGQAEIDDSWISSLLTLAPFVRIVEFFSAEIGDGGNQRTQRKEFMYNFYNDTARYEKDHMNSIVFARASAQNLHSSVQDIWFAAAEAELRARRAIPHDVEHVWIWNGIPIVFGCPDCHPTRGWQA
ncbi:uncharacterized protein N7500_010475 [Penicillium coprophilum]|uniref:uncharacterized protein n=1 Tax=Penicillium coprophilum TaxID=36646 RepID=UPI0023A5EF3B|nr:uncharacterized protein N7500_010475 [Penicillium coprophilum]KAJ5155036.1 hypothetical protein N7500_010475 [Penicillium coprophilum]